jgi:1-phosphofructokinase family hexose kinase
VILCVTPNTAIDRTLIVPGFRAGEALHAERALVVAGGKGPNVARVIRLLGGEARCAGFLGGHSGRLFAELAEREGLRGAWTWVEHETRTCVIIVDPEHGQATGIYEPGATVSLEDWVRLQADVLRESTGTSAVCFSGSLPSGVPPKAFADLIASLSAVGRQVWVDTSGSALQAALAARPFGIKVNGPEVGAVLGRDVQGVAAALEAADELWRAGPTLAVLTLGASGAVLVSETERWHAQPPSVQAMSSVGSGDAFLAGLVTGLECGSGCSEALRRAVAAGTANALSAGGGRFAMADFNRLLGETVIRQY